MNVRNLMARLALANPDDLVVIDCESTSLFVLNQKSGMYHPLDMACDDAQLTERDKQFLNSLLIRY